MTQRPVDNAVPLVVVARDDAADLARSLAGAGNDLRLQLTPVWHDHPEPALTDYPEGAVFVCDYETCRADTEAWIRCFTDLDAGPVIIAARRADPRLAARLFQVGAADLIVTPWTLDDPVDVRRSIEDCWARFAAGLDLNAWGRYHARLVRRIERRSERIEASLVASGQVVEELADTFREAILAARRFPLVLRDCLDVSPDASLNALLQRVAAPLVALQPSLDRLTDGLDAELHMPDDTRDLPDDTLVVELKPIEGELDGEILAVEDVLIEAPPAIVIDWSPVDADGRELAELEEELSEDELADVVERELAATMDQLGIAGSLSVTGDDERTDESEVVPFDRPVDEPVVLRLADDADDADDTDDTRLPIEPASLVLPEPKIVEPAAGLLDIEFLRDDAVDVIEAFELPRIRRAEPAPAPAVLRFPRASGPPEDRLIEHVERLAALPEHPTVLSLVRFALRGTAIDFEAMYRFLTASACPHDFWLDPEDGRSLIAVHPSADSAAWIGSLQSEWWSRLIEGRTNERSAFDARWLAFWPCPPERKLVEAFASDCALTRARAA